MQAKTETDRLLTVDEAAERLGCSVSTVRREIRNGALESVRIGPAKKLVRITDKAIRTYQALRSA